MNRFIEIINVSMATIAMKINASGAAKVKTVVLITSEQIDEATKINVSYRPPEQSLRHYLRRLISSLR